MAAADVLRRAALQGPFGRVGLTLNRLARKCGQARHFVRLFPVSTHETN